MSRWFGVESTDSRRIRRGATEFYSTRMAPEAVLIACLEVHNIDQR